jgi:hypothetical protein
MQNPWSAIEKPTTDLNVRLVDEQHPLKLFWGVDAKNRYSFAYDAAFAALPKKSSLPNLSGLEVYVANQGLRGKLVLLLQNNADWEIFHALCLDLVRATSSVKDESLASAIIVRRLFRWQELLRRNRPQILGLEEIKGLMGELLFLSQHLAASFGYDDAITAWRGPENGPQDFAIKETAIEIKCQIGGSKPVVRISSAEQLCPQLPTGYLVVYTLARQTAWEHDLLTLNSLVAAIRSSLSSASASSRERFEDLLYMAGFVTREEYDEFVFSVVAVKCYALVEGFPRVLSSGLPPGVESVSYSIRLDACSKFQSTPQWWPNLL